MLGRQGYIEIFLVGKMARELNARCGGLTMVHLKNCKPILSEPEGRGQWNWEIHIRGSCWSASKKPTLVAQ